MSLRKHLLTMDVNHFYNALIELLSFQHIIDIAQPLARNTPISTLFTTDSNTGTARAADGGVPCQYKFTVTQAVGHVTLCGRQLWADGQLCAGPETRDRAFQHGIMRFG